MRACTTVALCLLLAACGPRRLSVVGPVADPAMVAGALAASTAPEDPMQLIFEWQANDGGVRGRGRGVARVEPAYKARLDLFLANGETALRAALVEGELRLPPGAPDDMLPPPDLMWGALGVLRPDADAELLGGDRLEDGSLRLRYSDADGGELHYQISDGLLTRVDQVENGRVVQEVMLSFAEPGRYPTQATYRHRTEFRELRMTRESIEIVPPFEPDMGSGVLKP